MTSFLASLSWRLEWAHIPVVDFFALHRELALQREQRVSSRLALPGLGRHVQSTFLSKLFLNDK
jgi:hypothetical protein